MCGCTVPAGTVYCCFSGQVGPRRGYTRLLGSAVHAVEPPGSKTDNLTTRMPRSRHKEHDEMTDTQVTWLTQESHDRLKTELDQLISNRPVIAAEINDRREEGDLRENGGYHAAGEEQGQQEAASASYKICSTTPRSARRLSSPVWRCPVRWSRSTTTATSPTPRRS